MWIKPPLDPTNPVNTLYEFTTGQHEAFFPSPLYLHGTWDRTDGGIR